MFNTIYNTISTLEEIEKHTAILSICSILNKSWKVKGVGVVVFKNNGFYEPSTEEIKEIVDDVNSKKYTLQEMEILQFVEYYKYFQLYIYDYHNDKTALDFYPEEFFKAYFERNAEQLFINIFDGSNVLFIPTDNRLTTEQEIYINILSDSSQELIHIKDAKTINPMLKEYFKIFDPLIEVLHSKEDLLTNLENTLINVYGGVYRAIFIIIYNVCRFNYIKELNATSPHLSDDVYGFHKLLFYYAQYKLFGKGPNNYMEMYNNHNCKHHISKILCFDSEYEHMLYKGKIENSPFNPISSPIHKVFKRMMENLERNEKITSYLYELSDDDLNDIERKYISYNKLSKISTILRQFINMLIITNNKELFTRMLILEDKLDKILNVRDKYGLNDAMSYFNVPIYLTLEFYTLVKRTNNDKLIYAFVSVCLNPAIVEHFQTEEEISKNENENAILFNSTPGFYNSCALYNYSKFGYHLTNIETNYYTASFGYKQNDPFNNLAIIKNMYNYICDHSSFHSIDDEVENIEITTKTIFEQLEDFKNKCPKITIPKDCILKRLDNILSIFKYQTEYKNYDLEPGRIMQTIDKYLIPLNNKELFDKYGDEIKQILISLNCFTIEKAYDLIAILINNNTMLNYIEYIRQNIAIVNNEKISYAFYNISSSNESIQNKLFASCSKNILDKNAYKYIEDNDTIIPFTKYFKPNKYNFQFLALNDSFHRYKYIEEIFKDMPDAKISAIINKFSDKSLLSFIFIIGLILITHDKFKEMGYSKDEEQYIHNENLIRLKKQSLPLQTSEEMTKYINEQLKNKYSVISKAAIYAKDIYEKRKNDKFRIMINPIRKATYNNPNEDYIRIESLAMETILNNYH